MHCGGLQAPDDSRGLKEQAQDDARGPRAINTSSVASPWPSKKCNLGGSVKPALNKENKEQASGICKSHQLQ